MSKLTVQNAITQALKTPRGNAQVSKAEAKAIAKAALTETSGQPRVTDAEAKLIKSLLTGDSFEGTSFKLTNPARKVLESFAAAQGIAVTPANTTKLSTAELEAKVTEAAGDYLFPSETDIPLTFLKSGQQVAVTPENVVAAFAATADAQSESMFGCEGLKLSEKHVEERDATEFLQRYSEAYDPSDEVMVANSKKFAAVADLLKANLTDLHVYRFLEGSPEAGGQVSIFIAGKTASGEMVSVMTGAVET